MKTYSVKQIADMLNTNPETVRRWIRNGQLKADQSSRKNGNVITQEDLNKFLQASPKYIGDFYKVVRSEPAMGAVASSFMALPICLPAAVLSAAADKINKNRNPSFSKKDVKKHIIEEMNTHDTFIKQKLRAIEQMQQEIVGHRQRIEECKLLLSQLEEKQ